MIQHSSATAATVENKMKRHNLTVPGQDVKTEIDQMFDDYVGQIPVPVMPYIEVPVIVSDRQPPVMMIQPAVPPLTLLSQSPALTTGATGVIRAPQESQHPVKYNNQSEKPVPVFQNQCVHEVEKLMETKSFDKMLLDTANWMGYPQVIISL